MNGFPQFAESTKTSIAFKEKVHKQLLIKTYKLILLKRFAFLYDFYTAFISVPDGSWYIFIVCDAIIFLKDMCGELP